MKPRIPTSMTPEETAALVRLARGRVVVEVGSWLGHSTVAMASVAQLVYAVDWHRGDAHAGPERTAHEFLANLREHEVEDRVVPLIGKSGIVLPALRPALADIAFHDAYHGQSEVYTDALLLRPLVTGVIAFHDYGDGRFGVTEAVDTLVRDGWVVWEQVGSLIVTLAG